MARESRYGGPAESTWEALGDRECRALVNTTWSRGMWLQGPCGWIGETELWIMPGTGGEVEWICPRCSFHHYEEPEDD